MMKELLDRLCFLENSKLENENEIKDIKKKLESEYLTEEGYKDDYLTISYTKPSTSTSIDLSGLQKKEPELYDDLLNDYPKVTNRKGSYRYTFK